MNIIGEIRYYLGEGDYAQLKFSEGKNSLSIDIVMVPSRYRNRGIGTMLINRILLLADSMNKSVYLSARPIGSSSEEMLQKLVSYYERFGFKLVDRGMLVAHMSREAYSKRT